MLSISLTPEADSDLQNQADWYNEKKAGLGNRFYKSVVKVFNNLEKNAPKYEVKYHALGHSVRWKKTNNFPFLIHYIVTNNRVIILGILHEASEHQQEVMNRAKD